MKIKAKSATSPPKAFSELRGWPAIAQFLGMPIFTVHRWAKEGMPVGREGRNVVASRKELNRWLQRTSGGGVHVVTPGADLLKDLRASVAARKRIKDFSRGPRSERGKAPKSKTARKS